MFYTVQFDATINYVKRVRFFFIKEKHLSNIFFNGIRIIRIDLRELIIRATRDDGTLDERRKKKKRLFETNEENVAMNVSMCNLLCLCRTMSNNGMR